MPAATPTLTWTNRFDGSVTPERGLYRKCEKCKAVIRIAEGLPVEVLDWAVNDHFYREHANPGL